MPSPVHSQEFEVTVQALPMPPVAMTIDFGLEDDEAAAFAPVAESAGDAVAVFQQARDGAFHVRRRSPAARRGPAACGSFPGRCGRRRGRGVCRCGRRKRAAESRRSSVRSKSAPHCSSSRTRSGASWAWSWAMRQLFRICRRAWCRGNACASRRLRRRWPWPRRCRLRP